MFKSRTPPCVKCDYDCIWISNCIKRHCTKICCFEEGHQRVLKRPQKLMKTKATKDVSEALN